VSRIDELLARLAPEGVEHKALGETGTFVRGNGLQKKDLVSSGVPAIHYGQIHTVYGVWTTETVSFVTSEFAGRLRKAAPGDLVIATTSEDDEAVAKATAWLGEVDAVVSGDAYVFHHTLDPKYVAYFFQSERFQRQKQRGLTGAKVRRISGSDLAKIRVPVPPLQVQQEIVRMLDTFTDLEAELEAELEARREQYAHYCDQLLSFAGSERVTWTTLHDAGAIYSGLAGKSKPDFTEGNAPFVTYLNVFNNSSVDLTAMGSVRVASDERQNAISYGDILFTTSSESREEVGMSATVLAEPSRKTYLNSFCFGFRPNSVDELVPEFARHLFRARVMRDQIVRTANGVTRINIAKGSFGKIMVPLPDAAEQRRIAGALDKLDALVNDLTSGLPAEIEARRQQYAYYRDRLLTFKEATA
jgi:type I restriction enzyme S subunit